MASEIEKPKRSYRRRTFIRNEPCQVGSTVYFDDAEREKLVERARRNGRSLSAETRIIVRHALGLGDFGSPVASA